MFGIVENSTMARSVSTKPASTRPASSDLSPDELKELAETQIDRAMQIETGPERLRVLTIAGAMMNLAEIKQRLLKYERRLLN